MHDAYLNLLQKFPTLVGSERIITDRSKLGERVGIAYEDAFHIMLLDQVQFEDNTHSIFKRVILKGALSQQLPVAILPITKDNKAVLIKIWRHATQSYHIEIPRGLSEGKESALEAASRELFEETGYKHESLTPLGKIYPDSGILHYSVTIFLARVDKPAPYEKDPTECIDEVILIDLPALHAAHKQGELFGYPLADPFLTYALYQAIS
jgi:ADP-ribose pyrophosphatase